MGILKRALILATIFLGFLERDARAQLGQTNINGVQIDVRHVLRFGDTRDLDGFVILEFSGNKEAHYTNMSAVRLIRAVDNTGKDLMRAPKFPYLPESPVPTRSGFWGHVYLKSPAKNAKTIRVLECETELLGHKTNSTLRFVIENISLPSNW